MTRLPQAEAAFPGLKSSGYRKTSDQDRAYNCIAWAAGEQHRWWWPDAMGVRYWPTDVPRVETLEAFIQAFATLGYETTDAPGQAKTYESIAIYALSGKPKHAARQLKNGKWTSKLGQAEDIEHVLSGLDGAKYGIPARFVRRSRV